MSEAKDLNAWRKVPRAPATVGLESGPYHLLMDGSLRSGEFDPVFSLGRWEVDFDDRASMLTFLVEVAATYPDEQSPSDFLEVKANEVFRLANVWRCVPGDIKDYVRWLGLETVVCTEASLVAVRLRMMAGAEKVEKCQVARHGKGAVTPDHGLFAALIGLVENLGWRGQRHNESGVLALFGVEL